MAWHDLNFTMLPQEQSNWCWAAVASSVAAFFGANPPPLQCKIASQMLSDPFTSLDCCTAPTPAINLPWYLASPLYAVNHMRAWDVNHSARLAAVQIEIDQGLPIAARIAYRAGGAHFVVIGGYFDIPVPFLNDHLVLVTDPVYGNAIVPYEYLLWHYHDGIWTDTYYMAE